ncbi:MAG TPA: lipid-A-disaccharide synthase N-terminal domain-containing protein [Woeseiaceae bacterium]|nr:lipid-A-disaccharide synthase N-terminal domain-containing protein [Woeseiaceae bacterium]
MTAAYLWLGVGFLGQAFFFSRFLVQWLASEKAGRSVFPMAFWYLSLSGGFLLLVYAVYRKDPVFIIGQSTGAFIYLRNIWLRKRDKATPA